jgi:uncharacterized OB-fold protein
MKKIYAIVSFRNGGNFLYQIKSENKIDIDKVAKYFEKTEGWNEHRDNIELIEEIISIKI